MPWWGVTWKKNEIKCHALVIPKLIRNKDKKKALLRKPVKRQQIYLEKVDDKDKNHCIFCVTTSHKELASIFGSCDFLKSFCNISFFCWLRKKVSLLYSCANSLKHCSSRSTRKLMRIFHIRRKSLGLLREIVEMCHSFRCRDQTLREGLLWCCQHLPRTE